MTKIVKLASKKFTLTLLERVLIPGILSKESDYKTIVLVKDARKKVEITQDEIKKFKIQSIPIGDGRSSLAWDEKGAKANFQIEFSELEFLEIKLGLEELERKKKLTEEHISLYEKFVVGK